MPETVIHDSTLVEPGAELGTGVQIGPLCIIKSGAKLHDNVTIHGQAYIASSVTLGDGCEVFPHAVLGLAPQDFKFKGEDTRLVIGKRTIIREQVSMHPGTATGNGITRVGNDGYFMVGSHVGHDCIVGNNVVLSNTVALGGYVQIGDHANLSGLVGVHQFTRIGHHAFIGALAYVSCDVIPYAMVTGNPGHLGGLNVIGMQRAGMPRDEIRRVRAAYKALFNQGEGNFEDRLSVVSAHFNDCAPAKEIIAFIKARSLRPLCMPDAH